MPQGAFNPQKQLIHTGMWSENKGKECGYKGLPTNLRRTTGDGLLSIHLSLLLQRGKGGRERDKL